MWVVLRLLVSLAVGLAKFFWRSAGGGEAKRSGDTEWRLKQAKHKGRVVATTFGVPFNHPVFFRLTREGFLDRFFKSVGFTREVQTGDSRFDEVVYVSCDHPALAPVLQEDSAARGSVVSLFAKGARRIVADGEVLWVERKGDTPPDDHELGELVIVRDALNTVPAEHLQMLRDPFFWKALLVESIAWSVAIYGAPAVFEIATRSHSRYFDWGPVIKTGLLLAVGIFAFLFGLAWWLLRGSSRAHRVLTESLIVLLLGVPFSSIQLVSDVNIALDHSPAMVTERRVIDKYTTVSTGRKGRKRTHYHLRLDVKSVTSFGIPEHLQVSAALYTQVSKGGAISVRMHQGVVGIPWVEEIRPKR